MQKRVDEISLDFALLDVVYMMPATALVDIDRLFSLIVVNMLEVMMLVNMFVRFASIFIHRRQRGTVVVINVAYGMLGVVIVVARFVVMNMFNIVRMGVRVAFVLSDLFLGNSGDKQIDSIAGDKRKRQLGSDKKNKFEPNAVLIDGRKEYW